MKILTINDKTEEKFLRKKTADFDFSKNSKKDIDELIKKMKSAMLKANGIGLSANQIGLNLNFFVAQIAEIDKYGNKRILTPENKKFYAIFNPEITKYSKEKCKLEEGCLSVPGLYGIVDRPENIVLKGHNRYFKPITIKAEGLLARVFQHETDHLNGILFIDKAVNLRKYENVRKYENE